MKEISIKEKTVESEQKKTEGIEVINKTMLEETKFEKKASLSEDQKSDLHQEVRKYPNTCSYRKDIQLMSCKFISNIFFCEQTHTG